MSFKHKKRFGQNFLTNQDEILSKIMELSQVKDDEHIIEIGPGEGALTERLLEKAKKVTCIEIDRDLERILRKKFEKNQKFQLIIEDVLKVDFNLILSQGRVVANIPYYITSPIINKIIENRDIISEMFIMVQKEVAERICSTFGKERSVLTLAVEYYGKAEYLFTIPKEFFTPVPKVDSAFIKIDFYEDRRFEKIIPEELFFKVVKAGFANKRKNIVNNLSSLGLSKERIKEMLNTLNIAENERAENISIEEFIKIAKALKVEEQS